MSQIDTGQFTSQPAFTGRRVWRGSDLLSIGTLLYIVASGLFLAAIGENPAKLLQGLGHAWFSFVGLVAYLVPWWAGALIVAPFVLIPRLRRRVWAVRVSFLVALINCSVFVFVFGLVKNNLSAVVPFWADPLLSRVDLALHFGWSPHALLGWLSGWNTTWLNTFYLNSWVFFATYLPALLLVIDGNVARRRTFTILWMLCWVGLGNVLALVGMSYGPIFSDLFVHQATMSTHADVLALVNRPDASGLLAIKMHLWEAYSGKTDLLGSGISAFPSVHVGMATVVGLYIARRGRDWAAGLRSADLVRSVVWIVRSLAAVYVSIYLILSVYLGYHYAVDGYASIVLMGLAYAALRAREAPQPEGTGRQEPPVPLHSAA